MNITWQVQDCIQDLLKGLFKRSWKNKNKRILSKLLRCKSYQNKLQNKF
jgi:hypothetical protein